MDKDKELEIVEVELHGLGTRIHPGEGYNPAQTGKLGKTVVARTITETPMGVVVEHDDGSVTHKGVPMTIQRWAVCGVCGRLHPGMTEDECREETKKLDDLPAKPDSEGTPESVPETEEPVGVTESAEEGAMP